MYIFTNHSIDCERNLYQRIIDVSWIFSGTSAFHGDHFLFAIEAS